MARTLFGNDPRAKRLQPEQGIVNAIMSFLAWQTDVFAWEQENHNAYDPVRKIHFKKKGHKRNGVPDILGHVLVLGVPIGFYWEAKSKRGSQNDDQLKFEADAAAKGGIYQIVRSIDDARIALDSIRRTARARLLAAAAKECAIAAKPTGV